MTHSVNETQHQTVIKVNAGDILEIVLEETLTSGYEWAVTATSLCDFLSSDYTVYREAGIGAGGLRKMRFTAAKQGMGFIKLKNWQRWTGVIEKEFEVNVEIK